MQSHNDTNISMKRKVPEPVDFDMDFPHHEDLAPLSHVPIKPQRLDGPEFVDKENQGNILNQQHVIPEQKKIENKKEEKTASNQQTKEILKMIVDMNDV